MEDLPLGRIEALVPEFAVKDLPLGRTLMMMMMMHLRVKLFLMIMMADDIRGWRYPSFPDICLAVEEKPWKNLNQEN